MSLVNLLKTKMIPTILAGTMALNSYSAFGGEVNTDFIAEGCYINYEIKPGDNLYSIERSRNLKLGTLVKVNSNIKFRKVRGKKIPNIHPGDKILIPSKDCGSKKESENFLTKYNISIPEVKLDLTSYKSSLSCKSYVVKSGDNLYKLAKRADVNFSEFSKSVWDQVPTRRGKRSGKNLQIGQKINYCKSDPLLALFKNSPNIEYRIRLAVQLNADEIWKLRSIDRKSTGFLKKPKTLAKILGVSVGVGAIDSLKKSKSFLDMESTNNLVLNYDIFRQADKLSNRINIFDILALIKMESGGLAYAISPTGGIGTGQFTKWIYKSSKEKKSEHMNPLLFKESVFKTVEMLDKDIKKYGFILGISNHHIGDKRMSKLIRLAKKKEINFKEEGEKLLKLGLKQGILTKANASYFKLFLKKKRLVKNNKYLKPINNLLRDKLEEKLYNNGRVFHARLPDGSIQRSYLTQRIWQKIEEQNSI